MLEVKKNLSVDFFLGLDQEFRVFRYPKFDHQGSPKGQVHVSGATDSDDNRCTEPNPKLDKGFNL